MADRIVNTGFDTEFGGPLGKFRDFLRSKGIETNIISGVRDDEDQRQLVANRNATLARRPLPYPDRGPVYVAAPVGSSAHEYGEAADVQPVNPADAARMHKYAQQFGLQMPNWGGYDPYHVQLANWQEAAATQPPNTPWDQTNPANVPSRMAMNMEADGPGAQSGRPATPTPVQTTMFSGLNAGSRGMKNNNPGNLVANDWTASLPGYKGSDGRFAIFDTPQHGALALDQNLAHYGTRGIDTPLAIASTWAPASDNNNPGSYGAQIAKGLGVGLNDKVNINDPAIRAKVAQSIGLVENGPGKSAGFAVGVPGTTLNTSGTPAAVAGGPAAAGAPGAPAAAPGAPAAAPAKFADTPAGKSLASATKAFGGGGGSGGNDQPASVPPMQLAPPMATGGPMMMGAGGQNSFGQRAAQQMLAQQGFQTQPSLQYGGANAMPSPVPAMPLGQATGIPGLPGTTLNSPSQLQMALMTGQLSPYDIYAQQQGAYGGMNYG